MSEQTPGTESDRAFDAKLEAFYSKGDCIAMIKHAKAQGIDLHAFPRYDRRIRGVIQSYREEEGMEHEADEIAGAYGISDEKTP
ncbi:MAG: hypothetical protein WCO25_01155 [Candidatus Uhrbacteria bacterium]